MDDIGSKKELRKLSKSRLIEIIWSLQEIVDEQGKKISEVERYLKSFDNAHTPSSKKQKKNTKKKEEQDKSKTPRFPGKPKGGNGGGIKLPKPDKIVEHKLDACPDCNELLGDPVKQSKKTVIDLPEKLVITTEHNINHYFCCTCSKEIVAKQLPCGVYGKRVQSLTVMLKDYTLSHDKTARILRELGFPTISAPTTLNIIQRLVGKLEPLRNMFLHLLQQQPFVHADETGMRKDGKNGYVWGVFTNTISILSAQMSRARENIKQLLPKYHGVVICDGYNAYDKFALKQRCFAHLLREFKELAQKHKEIEVQYLRAKILYSRMKVQNKEPPNEKKIDELRFELQDITTCLNAIKQGRKLANHITNAGDDWFTALYYKDVPLENNRAERGLRHIVLHRKTMGCYRKQKGKKWIDVGISVLQTWRLQGLNVFEELCKINMT